jgi:hypothetical protein
MSIEELDRIIPVRPPNVNKKIKPKDQSKGGVRFKGPPKMVAIQLNTLIPVGIAIIMVAAVK